MRIDRVLAGVLAATLPCLSPAQQDTQKEIERYRQMLQESNPAELYEARGEELWKTRRGPRNASLERCDLGLGPGVVKGAYVRLPRYFADTGRVQDLESRLATCMVTLQGFTPEEARRKPFSGTGAPMITTDPFSGVGQRSVMTDLVAWIASESRGMTIAPSVSHPKERLAYQAGERLFYYRAGPYDFGCVTCHGEEGKRIRLQNLPKMTNAKDAQRAFGTWPGYRVSEGELRSMQWRMWECVRQMRFPELEFASDASIALITYLAKQAEGGTFDAPAIKR
ncbi:MAG: sulfur oxidation c-type cytochrome SoxA [Betaproteobacteria bacterium]|nr:MAG: sulfur oxidation c-type cytochrome SoxA [Betaproteobacteria bacterium]